MGRTTWKWRGAPVTMLRSCWSTSDRTHECLHCRLQWRKLVRVYKKKKSKYWCTTSRSVASVFGERPWRRTKARHVKSRPLSSPMHTRIMTPPKKAPTTRKVSVRFLEWVDSARLVKKSKMYYQDGSRLSTTTSILGMRLDTVNNDVAKRASVLAAQRQIPTLPCGLCGGFAQS